jgi:predicted dehydrogenase
MADKIRVAVVGVGHLGRYHAQKYAALPACELVGVVDADPARAGAVGAELGVPAHTALEAVLDDVQAVSIATPTSTHHAVGSAVLAAGRHVLMEKPLAATPAQAEALVAQARRAGTVLQVGYLERFNPALVACQPRIDHPQFIEAIRIAPYGGRGVDVDVVLDLMSHDLDLVLSLVDAPLAELHAVGLSLVTESTDLANVRLIFADGCVANLTASRISTKAERKMRLFQRGRYFSMDFAAPAAREYAVTGRAEGTGGVREERLRVEPGDALRAEIEAFLAAVASGGPPLVSGEDGLRAMRVSQRVIADIAKHPLP